MKKKRDFFFFWGVVDEEECVEHTPLTRVFMDEVFRAN